jgi:ABC-type phosphate/phosphonate transport system permease subunit
MQEEQVAQTKMVLVRLRFLEELREQPPLIVAVLVLIHMGHGLVAAVGVRVVECQPLISQTAAELLDLMAHKVLEQLDLLEAVRQAVFSRLEQAQQA